MSVMGKSICLDIIRIIDNEYKEDNYILLYKMYWIDSKMVKI